MNRLEPSVNRLEVKWFERATLSRHPENLRFSDDPETLDLLRP
ncbi:hypothetical protein [Natrinema sp. CBA1119]|nr:hypothetical protein [Natrinema sp. CBA1119]